MMFSRSSLPTLVCYATFAFGASLTVILAAASAMAQSDPGITSDMSNPSLGGKNTIQGHVFYPPGRAREKRLRVEMRSVQNGISSTLTDDDGSFVFSRLPEGTYSLTVDAGHDYEVANEVVQIIDNGIKHNRSPGQVLTVQIQLAFKSTSRLQTAVIDASLAGTPKSARELYTKALASAEAGDHKKAIKQLQQALATYPAFTQALNELGVQFLQVNEFDQAAESFREAIGQTPDAFVLHLNYGIVLLLQKNFGEAESQLRLVLKTQEGSAAAHLHLGRALIGLRRDDEAEKELRRALALGGDELSMAHRYLGAIYNQRGNTEIAIRELETYLKLEPKAKDAAQIHEILKELRATGSPGAAKP